MSFVKLPVLRHGLMARDPALMAEGDLNVRIERTRRLMSENNVAALLAYGDPTNNGPVSYLTNYPCFGLGRRATVALGMTEGPLLFTAEPSRNLPKVRLLTTCDLEKTRQFLVLGCERARKLSENGLIGLVGMENLPVGLVKDSAALSILATKDLTEDFTQLMAAKDESALRAQSYAISMAEAGLRLLAVEAVTGRDLWELAAYVDYRLRLSGCEDTNILLGTAKDDWIRPGYPARRRPELGDILVAIVAVQSARLWSIIGRTLRIGPGDNLLESKLALISAVQKRSAASIKAGMTLSGIEATFTAIGAEAGLTFAGDIPLATGVGFDLHEYPQQGEDKVARNTVLQVALTVDFEGGLTGMLIDMLHVRDNESIWLTGKNYREHKQN